MAASKTSYHLKRFQSSRDPDFAAAMMLYVRNIGPASRTNTNEIAHWTDQFESAFATPFYVFGFYRDRELVGFAEAAFLTTTQIFALDYLVLDEAHRRNNIFYEFVDHLKRFFEIAHPEYRFGVIEVPYGPGATQPESEARLLIRLMKLQGFHVVHALYHQPRLRLEDSESEMRAALLLYSPSDLQSLKSDTYLDIVRSVYYEYYLPWKSLIPERHDAYRSHLDRLFGSIRASLRGTPSVAVNGHRALLRTPERRLQPRLHRIVSFALQATVATLFLAVSLLSLQSWFELTTGTVLTVFFVAMVSFVALAGMVSKDAREVLRQLLSFSEQIVERMRRKRASPDVPPPAKPKHSTGRPDSK